MRDLPWSRRHQHPQSLVRGGFHCGFHCGGKAAIQNSQWPLIARLAGVEHNQNADARRQRCTNLTQQSFQQEIRFFLIPTGYRGCFRRNQTGLSILIECAEHRNIKHNHVVVWPTGPHRRQTVAKRGGDCFCIALDEQLAFIDKESRFPMKQASCRP